MLANRLIRFVGTLVVLLIARDSVVLAAKSNSSQHIVPNAAGDKALDHGKINHYKSVLDNFNQGSKFDEAFKWTDVVDAWIPSTADCSARCLTCAPGCSPNCCALGAVESSSGDDNDKKTPDVSSRFGFRPGHIPPIPAITCPCYCQASCPANVQAVCCFTPGLGFRSPGGRPSSSLEEAEADEGADDTQKSLLDKITSSSKKSDNKPHELIWGRPGRPLACPCFCDPTCPAYIQAVCCTTPGSNDITIEHPYKITKAPKTHDSLAMVTETARGEVVSVLAAINLTIFDSFITFNLVRGLERTKEITYNEEQKHFELVLTVVVQDDGGESKETGTSTLAQTFIVIDGTRLLEEEQILLGSGAVGRIGGVGVEKKILSHLQEGVPVLTGV